MRFSGVSDDVDRRLLHAVRHLCEPRPERQHQLAAGLHGVLCQNTIT
jgi:hypothetical protein